MKPVTLAFLPLLAATSAFAQSADAVTASSQLAPAPIPVVVVQAPGMPAPQNMPWTEVSHINGQIVPVGQHNDYVYSFKRTNISTNPLGWMVGIYGLSVEYAMTNNLAIRADGNLFNLDHGSATGYEVGLSVPIYLRRTYQGPFLEPGIMARSLTEGGDTSTTVGPEVMVGWHWTFDSGLNVAAALGVGRDMYNQNMSDDIVPAGYFRIGYAF